jgi:hypothetical protein
VNNQRILSPDYRAHQFLDPDYLQKDEQRARALYKTLFEIMKGPEAYNAHLNRFLRPWSAPHPLPENLALMHSYLREVDLYLRELLRLMPPEAAPPLAPLPSVTDSNDFLALMQVAFLGSDRRERFEAQRKLYLAMLFFDVDHTHDVQTGQMHSRRLEECLERELWSKVTRVRRITVCYTMAPDGTRMEYSIGRPRAGQDTWQVDLRRVRRRVAGRPSVVHIFYYSCRFKRQYKLRHDPDAAMDEGPVEEQIWADLQRGRSGSIVSKMIRKGEVDPHKIGDLIGAMFIVKDAVEVELLQAMLYDIFGGPMRWREDVDTIRHSEQRALLNEFSGAGYEVKKSLVGVLYQPADQEHPPYLFGVEFQIYTLEGFLRTVHSQHIASHERLKLRQFLEGLLPYLFPASVYGPENVLACFNQ